jgi:hypothetical protein
MSDLDNIMRVTMLNAINRDFPTCIDLIKEGLSDTAGEVARWLAQLGFEACPDLRVDDKGRRYVARPLACKSCIMI